MNVECGGHFYHHRRANICTLRNDTECSEDVDAGWREEILSPKIAVIISHASNNNCFLDAPSYVILISTGTKKRMTKIYSVHIPEFHVVYSHRLEMSNDLR